MRLTLRTLLAYLDDVLEPSETKEIGQKIKESPMAATLVSRIREVMRRRRLNAPELDGPGIGIDPNLVAQYLDNSLPAEAVASIERVFLESDQQLAEVAACHQILTLVLGEPVEVSAETRERMYVLGPVAAAEKLQTFGEPGTRGNGEKSRTPLFLSTAPQPALAHATFEETLPEYLRPKPWSGKVLSVAIGAVVFIIWLFAVISDQPLIKGLMGLQPIAQVDSRKSEPDQRGGSADEPPAEEVVVVERLADSADGMEQPEKPANPPDQIPDNLVAGEEAPVDATETRSMPDSPANQKMEETASSPPEPDVPEASPLRPAVIQYTSANGVLLRADPAGQAWYIVSKRAEIKPGAVLATPDPFESTLEVDGGAMQITLLGDSVVQILGPTKEASFGIGLISGQIVLEARGKGDQPVKIALAIGPQAGLLELGPGETVCGVEFLLKEPEGFEQPVPVTRRENGLYVISGSAGWLAKDGQERTANQGVYLNLLSDQAPVNFGASAGLVPDWLDPQRRKLNSVLQRSAALFEREFDGDQSIDSSLVALIRDPRSRISELAVRALVLTENIDAVVQALAQSPQEETRKAAAIGLQRWLGVSAERGTPLREALSEHYERADDVRALYRLLWGFSRDEAKQAQPSLDLVELLRSNHVAIRELAFANLVRLTNRKFDYRPLASPQQREPAVRRWMDFVQRDGALVTDE
ncbi:MAG: hypothetical protein U0872_08795 [Planctomycetaceae bacterium]